MKKILSVSIASLALAAMADCSSITVGVTQVSATLKNMIIPVPCTKIGSSDAVSVHDLVKAANLPANTMLYYYDGSQYYAWKVISSAWTAVDSASTISGTSVGLGSDSYTVSVGSALWVSFPSTPSSGQKIYVYGKPAETYTSTIVKEKKNLLSNPTSSTVTGSSLAGKLASIAQTKDVILPIGSTFTGSYVYGGTSDGWVHISTSGITKNATLPDLAAYQGFWYVSKSEGDNATINW